MCVTTFLCSFAKVKTLCLKKPAIILLVQSWATICNKMSHDLFLKRDYEYRDTKHIQTWRLITNRFKTQQVLGLHQMLREGSVYVAFIKYKFEPYGLCLVPRHITTDSSTDHWTSEFRHPAVFSCLDYSNACFFAIIHRQKKKVTLWGTM